MMIQIKPRTRPLIIAALIILFGALAAWWCVYFPYNRASLYRAIPRQALLVTEHRNLGARWNSLLDNALVTMFLGHAGLDENQIADIKTNANLRTAAACLASRDTLVAYCDSLGPSGKPAWVLSSWTGLYGKLIDWTWSRRLISDISASPVDTRSSYTVWLMENSPDQDGEISASAAKLSFAAVEGVLVACLSEDPKAAGYAAERISRHATPIPELAQKLDEKHSASPRAADEAWVVLYRGDMVRDRLALHSRLFLNSPGYALLEVTGDSSLLPDTLRFSPRSLSAASANSLARLIRTTPCAAMAFPFPDSLNGVCSNGPDPAFLKELDKRVVSGRPSFAFLLGGDHSGRMMVRIPTLVLALPVHSNTELKNTVTAVLDSFNSQYDRGLIPAYLSLAGIQTAVIDGTKAGFYSEQSRQDKIALTVADGWLVLSTSFGTLEKLLLSRAAGSSESDLAWFKALMDQQASLRIWADPARTAPALTNAIAAYELFLLIEKPRVSPGILLYSAAVRDWLKRLEPFEECRLALQSDADSFTARLHFGRPGQNKTAP
ncbi:MAG: hypothetical protein R6V03_01945 [Kiritimatiellia bacterium]